MKVPMEAKRHLSFLKSRMCESLLAGKRVSKQERVHSIIQQAEGRLTSQNARISKATLGSGEPRSAR